MDEIQLQIAQELNRRLFLRRSGLGLGSMALGSLLGLDAAGADAAKPGSPIPGAGAGALPGLPHFPAKAKRVIYLFQSGAPSQLDLFDHKPLLNEMNGKDLPDSIRNGQRLTGMSSNQATLPLAGSIFKFARHGASGAWVSDLLPQTAKVVDELCFIRSLLTIAGSK